MSVTAMAWVWEHSEAKGTALLLMLAIADHAADDGTNAWPGQKKLAAKCRVSDRTVRSLVKELEELGELTVESYAGPIADGRAGRRTNRYTITRLAEESSGNPAGSWRKIPGGCRKSGGGLSEVATSGEPSVDPSVKPSAPDVLRIDDQVSARRPSSDSLTDRLYRGLRERNPKVKLLECVEVVDEARAANLADHVIDEAIGAAIAHQAEWPSYVRRSLANRKPPGGRGYDDFEAVAV